MAEIIQTGKTVEIAIAEACDKLGVNREDTIYEIIDLPKKGFLGIGSAPAKVKVSIELPEEKETKAKKKPAPKREPIKPAPVVKAEPAVVKYAEGISEKNLEKVKMAKEYLTELLDNMGIKNAKVVEICEVENAMLIIEGEGLGIIIGRRGETLDAIQYLVSLVCNKGDENFYRISVDCENYKQKRINTLTDLAVKKANIAVKTGRYFKLEPMNPYERRIIHAAVATVEEATSSSSGTEPNRRVIISSKNAKNDRRPSGDRRRNDRPRGGDRRRDDRPRAPRQSAPAPTPAPNAVKKSDNVETPLYSKIEL